jgi:hypothetical protein
MELCLSCHCRNNKNSNLQIITCLRKETVFLTGSDDNFVAPMVSNFGFDLLMISICNRMSSYLFIEIAIDFRIVQHAVAQRCKLVQCITAPAI